MIPAGLVATLASARFDACDALTYGYQLDFGSAVTVDSRLPGCVVASAAGATVSLLPTAVLLRVFPTDAGWPAQSAICSDTFFSDDSHGLVSGSGPWEVDIMDGAVCTSPAADPRPVPGAGDGNLHLTIALG